MTDKIDFHNPHDSPPIVSKERGWKKEKNHGVRTDSDLENCLSIFRAEDTRDPTRWTVVADGDGDGGMGKRKLQKRFSPPQANNSLAASAGASDRKHTSVAGRVLKFPTGAAADPASPTGEDPAHRRSTPPSPLAAHHRSEHPLTLLRSATLLPPAVTRNRHRHPIRT